MEKKDTLKIIESIPGIQREEVKGVERVRVSHPIDPSPKNLVHVLENLCTLVSEVTGEKAELTIKFPQAFFKLCVRSKGSPKYVAGIKYQPDVGIKVMHFESGSIKLEALK